MVQILTMNGEEAYSLIAQTDFDVCYFLFANQKKIKLRMQ